MMDWEPIETAPRDGTEILGFWRYDSLLRGGFMQTIRWLHGCDTFAVSWDHDTEVRPTHWMPLPEPPK